MVPFEDLNGKSKFQLEMRKSNWEVQIPVENKHSKFEIVIFDYLI